MATAPPVVDVASVQRRTVAVLMDAQVLGGVGVAVSVAVGALPLGVASLRMPRASLAA
jgi:hypothetical protein